MKQFSETQYHSESLNSTPSVTQQFLSVDFTSTDTVQQELPPPSLDFENPCFYPFFDVV